MAFAAALTLLWAGVQAPDLVLADFEGADYGVWAASGEAFGKGPARGTLPNQMAVTGFGGRGLANSYYGADGSTGILASPPFRIERRYIQFLIGGGKDWERTALMLIVDGAPVRRATGPNDRPGGSEALAPGFWDVSDLRGRTASLRIVDFATGGWGHINVDDIVQTDRKPPELLENATRQLRLTERYLNLPVKTGGPKRRMTLAIEGGPIRTFEIELADGEPDWWAFVEVSEFRGRTATITVDRLPEDSRGLQSIGPSGRIKGSATLYREPLRPQLHFSPRRGWTNDPNGLVYYAGEYHLFFQHNPYGWAWGNMHWGHAVSRDLVHWEELPIALYPDALGTMYSGSAVVDEGDTGGFQTGSEKVLAAFFTGAGNPFTQGLAFSNDRGRTWTKYAGNPVLPHQAGENRDPKVIWYAPERKWVMALYLEGSEFGLYESRDLKQWRALSKFTIPGTSECPEIFEIPLNGDPKNPRWIVYGGNGGYMVGWFDGTRFTSESGPHALHRGNCWYASQTFNGIPAEDGRRILIPWGQIEFPGMPFNQMMGLPVELTLRSTPEGPRLFANPVRELEALRKPGRTVPAQSVTSGQNPLAGVEGELLEIEAEIAVGEARWVTLTVRGVPIVYDVRKQTLSCLGHEAPLEAPNGRIRLRVMVDRVALDLFGNEGRLYMPMGKILDPKERSVALSVAGGSARLERFTAYPLRSIWAR